MISECMHNYVAFVLKFTNIFHLQLQTYFHVALMRWVLACLIGVVTGVVAFLINISRRKLGEWKYDVVEKGI